MASLTPMMQQYLELKEKYSDCLLFFRLGDFYEMFFDDALTASRELEIVLTGRDCGLDERAPMCGVPYHSVDSYINKLIEKGFKVAICEQLTDPAFAKGLVERDVIRVITPGTVIEEVMLDDKSNNYIAAVARKGSAFAIAYCDVSTGDFYVVGLEGTAASADVYNEMSRISPREVILCEQLLANELLCKQLRSKCYVQDQQARKFDAHRTREILLRHFKVASLSCFGIDDMSVEASAAGALLTYLQETQKNSLSHIGRIVRLCRSEYMSLDAVTRQNLELTAPIRFNGNKKNTLLYVLDKTSTSMGGRLLRKWIEQPLQVPEEINERLDAIEAMLSASKEREMLLNTLNKVYDIERLCSRIAYAAVSPRDCNALRSTLAVIPDIRLLSLCFNTKRTNYIVDNLDSMDDVFQLLKSAITDDPPISAKDGGVIKAGYNKEIDELRDISDNAKKWLNEFETAEKERTGIKNLKVGYNRVFGYYIEISKSNVANAPLDYQRKQTLANSERYITPLLKQTEERILTARDRCIELEYTLFCEIRETLAACLDRLKKNALLIAELDVYAALAKVAAENKYCRPKLNNKGRLSISEGRHPIVEQSMREGFIANSVDMNDSDDRLIILTGPNMAGKSTYMRQIALITLMAHIGSFVPAKSANICITDRIFTRVGASDSLSSGQSTFMVEMTEMANILNNATKRSLLIIDEIGRGTSTFDGLSIAWAVVEHIADKRKCGAKALFATHYHELTELEDKLEGVKNFRVTVKEVGDDIIFLRKIMRGGADKSFGIQVARLAGLPAALIERAKQILIELEASDINNAVNSIRQEPKPEQVNILGSDNLTDIIMELASIDANKMSPIEALSKLYELSTRAKLV